MSFNTGGCHQQRVALMRRGVCYTFHLVAP
jgi:hypothetical protein